MLVHQANSSDQSFKEQMFATITFNIAIYTTSALPVPRSPATYFSRQLK